MATAPPGPKWPLVMDTLTTPVSESVGRGLAEHSAVTADLGVTGKCGMLQSMASRDAFLREDAPPIVVHFTPTPASWRNQLAIWLSMLVRKVIRRGNFLSREDRRHKIETFLEYCNRTMATPFRWTYQGKPLTA